MNIDKSSPIPAYIQLRNIIREKIVNKDYPPGFAVPSERELAKQAKVSRMTARQAFNALETEGILYREKGRGTFVSKFFFEQKNIMSFTDLVREKGFEPGSEVLCFEVTEPNSFLKEVFRGIGIKQLYHSRRLRLANSIPVAIEEVFIPADLCPGLDIKDFSESLYKVLKDKYGFVISSVESSISAIMPDTEKKELLCMPSFVPLLAVSSMNYSQDSKKVYYESSYYRADKFKYDLRLSLY